MESRLIVSFIDESYEVDMADSLTFGRRAAVMLDDANPYLHRIAGSFVPHRGNWWLRNDGTQSELSLGGVEGRLSKIPPGQSEPLLGQEGFVRLQAGIAKYELTYILGDPPILPPQISPDRQGTGTAPFAVLRLNPEQRLLLTAMAVPWLTDPTADPENMPANADVARELGWTTKKLDRKLDYLCRRFHQHGVRGLRGEMGNEAKNRRIHLVRHVLEVGMIDRRDLELLHDRNDEG